MRRSDATRGPRRGLRPDAPLPAALRCGLSGRVSRLGMRGATRRPSPFAAAAAPPSLRSGGAMGGVQAHGR